MLRTPEKIYCVFLLIHSISGQAEQPNLTVDCPVGCQCLLERVSDVFGAPQKNFLSGLSPTKSATCNGVNIPSLRDLSRELPDRLDSLTLKGNGLSNLMELCCLENLKYLDISFNNLSSIVTYSPFLNLTYLNLQNNNLRYLRQGAFTSFPNLEILNLDNNQIRRIIEQPFRLFRLKELYLSRNQIAYVSERIFRFTPELQILNLSGNKLLSIHNRNFYFSPNLISLDASYNKIVKVDDYAFENLPGLEIVNLAFNNLLEVPTKSFQGLKSLQKINLNGNPIKLIHENAFANLTVEDIRLSQSKTLVMALKNSFKNLTQLKVVHLGGNEKFVYISPHAFRQTPGLQYLQLEYSNLRLIPKNVLEAPVKPLVVNLVGNPLDCGCMGQVLAKFDPSKVLKNSEKTYCWTEKQRYLLSSKKSSSACKSELYSLDSKDGEILTVSLGAKLQLYCVVSSASEELPIWIFPYRNKKMAENSQKTGSRIRQTTEYLEFQFVLDSDAGEYVCSSKNSESRRKILLKVQKLDLVVYPLEISSYYVTIGWNQTLETNSEKGKYFLDLEEAENPKKVHTLLPHSILWRSYTLTDLRAETNYSACLVYQYDNLTLYKRCVDLRTPGARIGMARTLNYSILALVASCATFICAVYFARCAHRRFHIWQEQKYRSRMAESISGQSFLSSASSLGHGGVPVTYENIHMSSSLYSARSSRSDHGSRPSSCRSSGRRQRSFKEADSHEITRDLAL